MPVCLVGTASNLFYCLQATWKFPNDDYVYHIRKGCEAEYAAMLKEYEKK